jgi:hypothetical protein
LHGILKTWFPNIFFFDSYKVEAWTMGEGDVTLIDVKSQFCVMCLFYVANNFLTKECFNIFCGCMDYSMNWCEHLDYK